MKKDWKVFQSLTNICSGSILLPRLMTVALLLLVAGISGCDSSTNAQSPQQKWTGEWELKNPYSDSQSQNARIILTPEGKAYLIGPYSPNENIAYEIPLKKVSENTTLPVNIKVVTVQEQMNQARTMRNIARITAEKPLLVR